MSGASYTELYPGTGGDKMCNEDIGGSPVLKMPCTKIYTGALGSNGGPVTAANPLDVRAQGGGPAANAAAQAIIAASDRSVYILDASPGGAPWSDFTPTSVAAAGGQIIAAASTRYLRRLVALNLHTASVNVAVFNGPGTWGTATNLIDFFAVGANSAANPRSYDGGGIAAPNGIYCLFSLGFWPVAISVPGAGCVFFGRSV